MKIHTQTIESDAVEARGGIRPENLDEQMKAARNWNVGQQQFHTPKWIVDEAFGYLGKLVRYLGPVLDPQCGNGDLLKHFLEHTEVNIVPSGIDIDLRGVERARAIPKSRIIRGNCVEILPKIFEKAHVLDRHFDMIIANPPFGLRWNLPDGGVQDSTEWTWDLIKRHSRRAGVLIYLADNIEDKGWNLESGITYYKRFSNVWKNVARDVGVLVYEPPKERWNRGTVYYGFSDFATKQSEEDVLLRRCNVEVEGGKLDIYLSSRTKERLDYSQIQDAKGLHGKDPIVLSIDRAGRNSLNGLIGSGVYTISESAKKLIRESLDAYEDSRTPIMPTTDYQDLAYLDVQDHIECIKSGDGVSVPTFTVGKLYDVSTYTRKTSRNYEKKVVRLSEDGDINSETHKFQSSGLVRIVQIGKFTFAEKTPFDPKDFSRHLDERVIWEYFKKPVVQTVKERYSELYKNNIKRLELLSSFAKFTYFDGQMDFIARIATKPFGVISAEVGCGKSLMAISVMFLKSADRILLIAPQATVKGAEDEEGKSAAQWCEEMEKFAPFYSIFKIYCKEDFEKIVKANNGNLPKGVYISYWEAMFLTQSWTEYSETKTDRDLAKIFEVEVSDTKAIDHSNTIGTSREGIRCVAIPTLADVVNGHFDMIIMDEAHKVKNKDALTTKNMLRLQARYRFLMTATPIPNLLEDMFTLMGWVSVPEWHRGDRKNSTWPFLLTQSSDFASLFLTKEQDLTEVETRLSQDKDPPAAKSIPKISNAPTLLKLIAPIVAYIDKKRCSSSYVPGKLEVIKVPMEASQYKGYIRAMMGEFSTSIKSHWRKKGHIQSCARDICADPYGFSLAGHGFESDGITPKLVTILGLIRKLVVEGGEQCVVLSARVRFTDLLISYVERMGLSYSRIDSGILAAKQAAQAELFKTGESKILFMGNRCAQAHSFPKCPNLIVASLEYSYGPLVQGFGRVDRINSVRPPTFYVVLHSSSIEETIFERVGMKKDAATLALHGEMLPSEYVPMSAENYFAEVFESLDFRAVSTSMADCLKDIGKIVGNE